MTAAGAALDAAAARLGARLDAAEARRDARLLLLFATGWTGAALSARMGDPLDPGALAAFERAVEARVAGRSVAHVTGRAEFYGRPFHVGPGDLAPRPDTESLVDLALSRPFERLLDLGTGTGVIAISLLAERPQARGLGTDLDAAALATAGRNRARHGLGARLDLAVSDWFAGVRGTFDLIVSNPPYVTEAEHAALPPEITAGERRAALTPGGDGLDAYRAIARGAPAHLAPGGRILVEIGLGQGPAVAALFGARGLAEVTLHGDLTGRDRIVAARLP